MSGAGLNLHSVVSVVQQTMAELDRSKQEVKQLQQREDLEVCRKFRQQLLKVRLRSTAGPHVHMSTTSTPCPCSQTVQDLDSVSELLDSCTLLDLGSQLQTSKLLDHFSQARPHFTVSDCWTVRTWTVLSPRCVNSLCCADAGC